MTYETDSWVYWRFKNGHENIGAFGEQLWSRIINGCGFFYIKLADMPAVNRKGPRLTGSDAILPDFQVSGRRQCFIDSKCKTGPVLFGKANELRHGIDLKCWESYQAISGITRQRCALAICELFDRDQNGEWSGTLMLQTLGALGRPSFGFSTQSHIVYWPRSRFHIIAQSQPLGLWAMAHGRVEVDAETRREVESVLANKAEPALQSRMF